jgi:predicted nucleic acid-binding protein
VEVLWLNLGARRITGSHNVGYEKPLLWVIDSSIAYMLYVTYMIRTQVYLTNEQARDIKLQAKRQKKREAEVIRDLLNKGLDVSRTASRETAGEVLLRLAKLGEKLGLGRLPTCRRGLMTTYMATSNQGIIIADTSGLVSLFSPNARNHAEAVKAAERLRDAHKEILLPAAVFAEFLNVLGRSAGHTAALAAVAELTPPFLVLSEPNNLLATPALWKSATVPQSVSFTDCLVMAAADEYATLDIFGFDKQFEDAGYRRLQPSGDWEAAA